MINSKGSFVVTSYDESCCRVYIILLTFLLVTFGLTTVFLGLWIKCSFSGFGISTMDCIVNIPYFAIAYGLSVLVCGITAFFLLRKSLFLFMYASCLFTLTIFGITLGVVTLVINTRSEDIVMKAITTHMDNYLSNPKDSTMDRIQLMLDCCGNNGPGDWLRTPTGQVPPSCCKMKLCDTTKSDEIYTVGCTPALRKYVQSHTKVLSIVVLTLSLIPMVGCIVTFIYAHIAASLKYQAVEGN